jgi:arylformamidase
METTDKRVRFDFEIEFTNGRGIQGQDFRLDIVGDDITDEALANYIVSDMRLLMVRTVRILNKHILAEAHKRPAIDAPLHDTRLIDLSHTISNGMITYKGLPAPLICDYLSRAESRSRYAPGTEFQIGKIEMVTNTGTYIDSPFHRYEHGKDLSEIALEALTDLPSTLVRVPHTTTREIDVDKFHDLELRGRAVIVHTGWDEHWNTEQYFENHPFLTEAAAQYLRDCNVKLVGIDSHNIDDTRGNARPVHSLLLDADILIVEHLCNLQALPPGDFRFTATPPKWSGVGTFPVRAFATCS